MKSFLRAAALAVAVLVACGCAKKAVQSEGGADAGAAVAGVESPAGAYLAYEHAVRLRVPRDSIGARVDAVREACTDGRFGACSVLALESSSGASASGSVTVRAVPQAVEPLVALGGKDATQTDRSTKAEDLADAVADVARRRDLAQRQRAKLLELAERDDIGVGDFVIVSRELAALEAELDRVAQTDAEQRRRLETNRLTLTFWQVEDEDDDESTLAQAWESLFYGFDEGLVSTAEYVGYFLPLLVVVFPFALLWRWGWRKATRAKNA